MALTQGSVSIRQQGGHQCSRFCDLMPAYGERIILTAWLANDKSPEVNSLRGRAGGLAACLGGRRCCVSSAWLQPTIPAPANCSRPTQCQRALIVCGRRRRRRPRRDLRSALDIRAAARTGRSIGARRAMPAIRRSSTGRARRNLARRDLAWPAPQRFSAASGCETFGYERRRSCCRSTRALAQRRAQPLDAARAARAISSASEICVPHETRARARPAGRRRRRRPAIAPLIDRFAAQVPGDGAERRARAGRCGASDRRSSRAASISRSRRDQPLAAPDADRRGRRRDVYFGAPDGRAVATAAGRDAVRACRAPRQAARRRSATRR